MAKKIILVNIVKNYFEIDWILPVIEELSKTHDLLILFDKKEHLNELKKNTYLFHSVKNITDKFYTINLFDKIILKLYGIFSKYFTKFNYLNRLLFNPKLLFFTKKINFEKIEFFFSDINSYCPLAGFLQGREKRPVIVRYPNSPLIYSSYDGNKIKYSIVGDILFLNYDIDKNFWKNKIEFNKMKSIGTPKYQKKYLDRAINFKKEIEYKNYLLVAYSSRFGIGHDDRILEKQLIDIMDTLIEINEKKIVLKIHPRLNNNKYLEVLSKYNKNRWYISNDHITPLIYNSEVFLHESNSASLMEGLALGKKCIEYWDPFEKNKFGNFKNNNENINIKANNSEELKNLIHSVLDNKDQNLWENQKKNYLKIINKNLNPIKSFIEEIKRIEHKI